MKAVATALVLITGAAVVLWYGNTLNSWVLGGLIGGLAALLLSIPISLTLFSFFSRRQDERERRIREEEEEYVIAHEDYIDVPAGYEQRFYEQEQAYLPPGYEEEEAFDQEEEYLHQMYQMRESAAYASRELSLRRQEQMDDHYSTPLRDEYTSSPRLPSRNGSGARAKDVSSRQFSPRRTYYPGVSGNETGHGRSQYQSEALRIARMEAAEQSQYIDDEAEIEYPGRSRRSPRNRSRQFSDEQIRGNSWQRSSRQLLPPGSQRKPLRPRRVVDATPSQPGSGRSFSTDGDGTSSRSFSRRGEPQTDHLRGAYAHTDPIDRYPSSFSMGTGGMRSPRQSPEQETTTGHLRKSLVRRPPYMYEDDTMRKDFAQQIDQPVIRRSSRMFPPSQEDEGK